MASLNLYDPTPSTPKVPDAPDPSSFDQSSDKDAQYRLHRRFDRLGRLYGDSAVNLLMKSKVVVFGLGGVGSFAAESLARSAIGHLMLVDFDDVCVTNVNRQLQAMQGTVGKAKSDVLRDRLRLINPPAKIESRRVFYKAENSERLLQNPWDGGDYDYVVDCIDNFTAKAHLLDACKKRGIPVISSMGAAGKLDPTMVKVADLAKTQVCTMARQMKKILRRKYNYPRDGLLNIEVVYSNEHRHWPRELTYDGGEGFKCVCPNRNPEHGCDNRALIDGTASFVTGTFGLTCASRVINNLTRELQDEAAPAISQKGTIGKKALAQS